MSYNKLYLGELQSTVKCNFKSAKKNLVECIHDKSVDRTRAVLALIRMYDRILDPDLSMKDADAKEMLSENIPQIKAAKRNYYSEGLNILREKPQRYWYDFDYLNLGELELYAEKYDEALRAYEKALELRVSAEAYTGLGVAFFKKKKYSQALVNFRKAIFEDPSDFNARNNAAECFFFLKEYETAQSEYMDILKDSKDSKGKDTNVDALLGLANLCRDLGDSYMEEGKKEDALSAYLSSEQYYKSVSNAVRSQFSRDLKNRELDEINYNCGRICFNQQKLKNSYSTKKVLPYFEKINADSHLYNKTQDSISKVKESAREMGTINSIKKNYKSTLIVMLAGFLFLIGLYPAIISYPETYVIDKEVFFEALDDQSDLTKKRVYQNIPLKHLRYDNSEKLHNVIETKLTKLGISHSEEKVDASIITQNTLKVKLDSVIGLSVVFSALLFLVVGLYIEKITRLKIGSNFGNIELDKNSESTVSTGSNTNVSLKK